ncbi:MAG: alpha/beta hydrolase [Coriobacteriia bacterium]
MERDVSCLIFEPLEMSAPSKSTTVLLFHGGSSNNESLRPLSPYFEAHRLLLPQAPIKVGDGVFDWFRFIDDKLNVDVSSLENSITSISPLVREVRSDTDGKVVVAGISQGAVFAGELFFRNPEQFDGLMMLSGFIRAEIENQLTQKEVFVAHGLHDQLIPIEQATKSVEILRRRHANVQFKTYDMGHDISAEEIGDAVAWLSNS